MNIQKVQIVEAKYNNNTRKQTTPTFKGGADSLIKFWDTIGRGGWSANFVLQDVAGNNVPRTTISLHRNKEELGHLNYMAASETFLRESLSGPSMVAVPLGIMALSTRLAGPATKIPTQNIADFSQIMKTTLANFDGSIAVNPDILRKTFYTNVLDAAGTHSLDGATEFTAHALEEIGKIEGGEYPVRNFLQKFLDKPLIKDGQKTVAKDQAISKLKEMFSKLRQQKAAYGEDFLSAKIAKGGKSTEFTDLMSQMKEFFDDFSKKYLLADEVGDLTMPRGIDGFVDRFKNLRTGQRFATGIAMTSIMMLVLTLIPKIYTLSKTNPELSKNGTGGGK